MSDMSHLERRMYFIMWTDNMINHSRNTEPAYPQMWPCAAGRKAWTCAPFLPSCIQVGSVCSLRDQRSKTKSLQSIMQLLYCEHSNCRRVVSTSSSQSFLHLQSGQFKDVLVNKADRDSVLQPFGHSGMFLHHSDIKFSCISKNVSTE